MSIKELWVEKYRPKTIADYVWIDNGQKHMVQSWIKDKSIPHLLLSGGAGTGKTTLAKVLINELGVHKADVMIINASRDNGVEDVRKKITGFGQTMPFGTFKIILLDEADYLSDNAQAALRGVMEQYSSVLRFIITCNYPQKIIPALHSRCQGFSFRNLDETDFIVRVGSILAEEGVDFDNDTLKAFVKAHYPDLRKTINTVQQASTTGTLIMPEANDDAGKDYRLEMVGLFRAKRFKEARRLICSQVSLDEYNEMYKFLYRNLDFWGANDTQQDEAILIIRQGLINHGRCADPEINLSATLIELERIGQ
jgi:DNA polymerase III delta prime subunit